MKQMGFACLFLLLVTACKKDDGPRKEAEKNLISANWSISRFEVGDNDLSFNYEGYLFVFNEDGSVDASNGSISVQGTWEIKDSITVCCENLYLCLSFQDNLFTPLNLDWYYTLQSAEKIELMELVNGEMGHQFLTLEKN